MNGLRRLPTDELWKAIEYNAKMGQIRTNWIEYLDNIRILVAAIDERIEAFQRQQRTDELIQRHRTADERLKQAASQGSIW